MVPYLPVGIIMIVPTGLPLHVDHFTMKYMDAILFLFLDVLHE